MFCRVLLNNSHGAQTLPPFRCETEHVIAEHYVREFKSAREIKSLLDMAKGGVILASDGTPISILIDHSLSVTFSPIRHAFVPEGVRVPNLRVSGVSKHILTTGIDNHLDIDWELKAAAEPFENLDDLLRQCSLPIQSEMGDSSLLEVIAATPVAIADTSIIKDGHAVIECRMAAGLAAKKIQLGYKVFQGGGVVRRECVNGDSLTWKKDNTMKIGTYKLPVEEATLVQAFVSYAGVSQHQWWVADPNKRMNPRYAIHQIFDDDMELLRKMLLRPDTDKPYAFEHAVSMLFDLLGFSITNYGRIPKLQKGPDVIAISPLGNIAVVECTIGLIDQNDKLAKLVQREKLIRDKLENAGYGYLKLLPVIITPLPRTEIAANLDVAGKHNIAVICREDIEEMIGRVALPLNPDQLFEDAKRLVPNMMQNLFGGSLRR